MPHFPEAPPAAPVAAVTDAQFDAFLARYRESVPNLRRFRFMNHASVGPLSTWVVDAANEMLAHQLMADTWVQDAWFDGWRLVRQRVGELLDCGREDICLHSNTYIGMMRAFQALPLGRGDEAICSADEFPSLYHALSELRGRGVNVVEAQSSRGDGIVRTEDVLSSITPATRVIALSWVNFFHGYTMDLARVGAVCRERGIWFLVDGIQALGALFLDVKACGIHFLSCNGGKWMCSPLGSGFLYVDPGLGPEISPRPEGWFSLELNHERYTDRSVRPKTNANRFGTGTVALPSAFGMRRSCEVFLEAGRDRVQQRALANADLIDQVATEAGIPVFSDRRLSDGSLNPLRSAIVSLSVEKHPGLTDQLRQRDVVFSVREGKLRLSPHWYQTETELDPVLETLRSQG